MRNQCLFLITPQIQVFLLSLTPTAIAVEIYVMTSLVPDYNKMPNAHKYSIVFVFLEDSDILLII